MISHTFQIKTAVYIRKSALTVVMSRSFKKHNIAHEFSRTGTLCKQLHEHAIGFFQKKPGVQMYSLQINLFIINLFYCNIKSCSLLALADVF